MEEREGEGNVKLTNSSPLLGRSKRDGMKGTTNARDHLRI